MKSVLVVLFVCVCVALFTHSAHATKKVHAAKHSKNPVQTPKGGIPAQDAVVETGKGKGKGKHTKEGNGNAGKYPVQAGMPGMGAGMPGMGAGMPATLPPFQPGMLPPFQPGMLPPFQPGMVAGMPLGAGMPGMGMGAGMPGMKWGGPPPAWGNGMGFGGHAPAWGPGGPLLGVPGLPGQHPSPQGPMQPKTMKGSGHSRTPRTPAKSGYRTKSNMFSLEVPFTANDNSHWETGGTAVVQQENGVVRLTDKLAGSAGSIWNRLPSDMPDWEVQFDFQISGEEEGGHGFAMWYVEKKMIGPVFGSSDYWNGLGIFFDTFNNDGKGANPIISAQFNDGTQKYFGFDDGQSSAIAACSLSLRNHEEYLTARVTYLNKVLTVEISNAEDEAGELEFMPCLTAENVELGLDKFFGFTATTQEQLAEGQEADIQDISHIATHDLSDPAMTAAQKTSLREQYRQEIEETHDQTPNHKDLAADVFQHEALANLHQITGVQQMMQQNLLSADQHVMQALQLLEIEIMDDLGKITKNVDVVKSAQEENTEGIFEDLYTILNTLPDLPEDSDDFLLTHDAFHDGLDAAFASFSTSQEQMIESVRRGVLSNIEKERGLQKKALDKQISAALVAAIKEQGIAGSDLPWFVTAYILGSALTIFALMWTRPQERMLKLG